MGDDGAIWLRLETPGPEEPRLGKKRPMRGLEGGFVTDVGTAIVLLVKLVSVSAVEARRLKITLALGDFGGETPALAMACRSKSSRRALTAEYRSSPSPPHSPSRRARGADLERSKSPPHSPSRRARGADLERSIEPGPSGEWLDAAWTEGPTAGLGSSFPSAPVPLRKLSRVPTRTRLRP